MRKTLKIATIVVTGLVVARGRRWRSRRAGSRSASARGIIELDRHACRVRGGRSVGPARQVPLPVARLHGMPRRERRRTGGRQRRGRDVHQVAEHQPGTRQRRRRATRETDWVRTIRHGVSAQKHPMTLMPSRDYSRMTDADLAALVAYVRSLPPGGGRRRGDPRAADRPGALCGRRDQGRRGADRPHAAAAGARSARPLRAEHGRYVAYMCTGCHGDGFCRRQDSRHAARLARRPPISRPDRGSAMPSYDAPEKFASDDAHGQAPGRPRGERGDAVRDAAQPERRPTSARSTCS